MHTFTSNAGNSYAFSACKKLLKCATLTIAVLAGLFCSNTAISQTLTCATATTITTVNATSCTPTASFNISGTGTGPSMTTCNTSGTATNNWGQFVAAGPNATISYDPPGNRDAMIYAYSGTCGSLTELGCVDAGGNGTQEDLVLTGLTTGDTYYFRIVRYNSTGNMSGTLCIASPVINTITTGAVTGSPFCGGSSVSVPFTSVGTFSGNTYTAQLSSSTGSFASPVTIGTLVSNANAGTITATLPTSASGSSFRIRVVSSSPAVTGTNNGTNLTINPLPQGSLTGNTVCGVGTGQLTFTASGGTGPFTILYDDGLFVRTKTGAISGTPFSPAVPPLSTTNYTLVSLTDNNGCIRTTGFTGGTGTITISVTPTIASASAAANICYNTGAQSSTLAYGLTTGSPTQYAISWNAAALAAGLVNLSSTAITASPLDVPVSAGVNPGTYTGTLTVTNAAGCTSSGSSFTLTINPSPTITAAVAAAAKCFTTTARNTTLGYSATTGSPTDFTISWDAAALAAGMTNVGSTALPASPITFSIPGNVPANTYNGTLVVSNGFGCSSGANAFTVSVIDLPTATVSATATPVCISGSAQNSTLSYSATTGTPTNYTIVWDAAAQSAGLVNTPSLALSASPVNVPVAGGVPAGTYNGLFRVINAFGCRSATSYPFTLTINNTFPVMTSASSATICSGGTVNIPLTSSIPSTFTWIATDNLNVSGESTTLQTTSSLNNTLTVSSGVNETVNYSVIPTSTGGCSGAAQAVTVTINSLPTITIAATTASRCYSTGAQTTTLSYSATTNAPATYTINWNLAAQAAGLVNVPATAIPASPFIINVPAGLAPANYTGVLRVSNGTCNSTGYAFTFLVGGIPTITPAATASAVCYNAGSAQNAALTYSATTHSPNNYSITWDAAALAAGLVNLGSTALPASPVQVPIAAGVATGTYNGTITVTNAAGCTSGGNPFTVTVNALPTITTSAAALTRCFSSTAQTSTLAYSSTTNSPTQYNIVWNAAALAAGLVNTGSIALPASPLNVPVAAGVAGGTYTGTLIVRNANGCSSTGSSFTITINPLPTITTAATAAARCFSSSGQTTTLTYSATTNAPVIYSITWNAAALAAGLVNVSSTSLSASPIIFPIAGGVSAGTYTGTLTVTNANGCSSTGNTFTLTINASATITTQPADQTACSGSSVSFNIAATGTALTYQWRRGTTNLCNCGSYSGVTTATLTINPVSGVHAAADYNCVVTSGSCSGLISNYVSLTVNSSVTAPSAQGTALTFPTVGTTSIIGTFTKSVTASNYLVIRTATATAPSNPANGTTYTQGTSALGGFIQYVGTSNVFTSTGLSQGTTYYYWVYAYNSSGCGTSPMYLTTGPLSGNVTTATNVSCGTVTTLYWGGTGSNLPGAVAGTDFNTPANWSTSGATYVASPVAPTQCNTVSLDIRSNASITLSADAAVYNFTYTITGNGRATRISTEGFTLIVNGDAVVDVRSGNATTSVAIGENSASSGIVDFKGNVRLGETYFTSAFSNIPQSLLIGNINSKIIFRGDVLFGRTAKFILPVGTYPPAIPVAVPGAGTTPGTIEFDGQGLQQVLWNNNWYYDNFYNIVVGNVNKPYVKHVTGTYTPDNILNNFTINDGCTVDLGSSQWIRESQGGTFTMNGTAKLILGNDKSVQSSAGTGVRATGSNFPGGFTTMNIAATSTIEYNGGNGITQTVYGTPAVGSLTYGNLILSNIDGTGTANKNTTSVVTVAGATTVDDKTTLTLGANFVANGNATVNSGGALVCGTRIVSGTGLFTLSSGGTLFLGSTAGITSSGATGNIQTNTRTFNSGANYVYNGGAAQVTGNGLPRTVNNLSINNASGVTLNPASANYTVAGVLRLSSGAFAINGDTLTVSAIQRTSGTLSGSGTSSVGISGTSVPLFFTSGTRILKNLFLNSGASADLQTALDITAGSAAGSVAVGSGATLNTFNNLVLKSDANGTARIAEIPVDGSGNALGTISGDVEIERFIPAKRGYRMLTMPVSSTGAPSINATLQEGVVNYDMVYGNNLNPNPGFGIHISGSSSTLGFDPTPLNNPSMFKFNRATGAWSGIASTYLSVKDQEGYMVFVRGNRSTNLSLNTSAPISDAVLRVQGKLQMGRQTISLAGGTGTYSVIGNPFASTIDFRNITKTGAVSTTTFVIWDPALTGTYGVGAYQYFTLTGANYTVFPGGGSYGTAGTINNLVQAGQAFLIQNTGAGSVIINENTKVSSSNSNVFRPMPDNSIGRISTLLSSVETDGTTTLLDGALVLYGNDFSDDLDMDDAKKLLNNSENFGISTGASLYQIEKRLTINETDTIRYSSKSLKIKNYQLAVEVQNIDRAAMTAYLKDNYTNIEMELYPGSSNIYPFSATADPASKAADRFKIYFKSQVVLPVTFTSIEAKRKNKTAEVEWKVQGEINIKRYEVERSADGIHFTSRYSVSSVANNNSANNYLWTDEHPLMGYNYFRVKSVDNDGREKYTGIAKVFFTKNAGISVFPNPVMDGNINVVFTEQQPGNYIARLYNGNGQLVKTAKLQQQSQNGNAVITLDNEMPHGNYVLEIIKPDNTAEHIKIMY